MLNFLGNVNLFHGRIHHPAGEGPEPADNTVSYVRSHDLEIDRSKQDSTSLEAQVKHIQKLGPSVRVTLTINGSNELIEAELTRDVFNNLSLQRGEAVFVRPRQVRVFVEDYQI